MNTPESRLYRQETLTCVICSKPVPLNTRTVFTHTNGTTTITSTTDTPTSHPCQRKDQT